jgi:cell division protein FtsW
MMAVRTYDRWLLILALMLVCFGALMVYSSTSVVTPGMEKKRISEFYYFKKHIFSMAIGLVVMYAAYRVRPSCIRKAAVPLLVLSFVLLVLVFLPGLGVSAGGARRWIRLWPTTFQPSELVKLAMVIFLAQYMSGRDYRTDRFACFLVPVGVVGVFQAVFIFQPDFGAAMSLGALALFMLFISGTRLRYIASLLVLCSPVLVKLLMEPYRLKRITAFLDPWKHHLDSGFQLVQSFLAFGSGGLTGVGLGRSRQKLDFLPEVHTDFIFSMVGEEMGFIVAVLVVACFALIFLRGMKIAAGATDSFAFYLTFGLSMMLALQAMVNFCVVTGMLPTKGLPLPFLSYGGSSLLINMAAVGMLLNFSRPGIEQAAGDDDFGELIRRKKARRAVYGGEGLP